MRLILANPRGFCAGVYMAIDVVDQLLDILEELELPTTPLLGSSLEEGTTEAETGDAGSDTTTGSTNETRGAVLGGV